MMVEHPPSAWCTVAELLSQGSAYFDAADLCYGHGFDNSRDEVLHLILYVLGISYHMADQDLLAKTVNADERQRIDALFARRVNERIPVAYLSHQAYFAGLSFYVDERVLIPRSPIAELIEQQFNPWLMPEEVTRILDIGTGSGCIAVAAACAFPQAQVDALDVSAQALAVARINCDKHGVTERVHLLQSDMLDQLPTARYDLIISNPPYVAAPEMDTLPAEYLHEPSCALAAGQDGLQFVTGILQQAGQYLSDGGVLIVEVGNAQAALSARFPQVPFLWLEFARGGQGVFLLTKEQLDHYL